jgi:DNA-binding response OmpR family regulator
MGSQQSDLAGRRVLVIEDETLVSMLLQDMLEDIGCEVVGSATRLNEAMEKATSLSFDIAILDANLNGERTFPIADLLTERGVGFVFATGYGAASLPSSLGKAPVLQKPFDQGELERAMRSALT